jgi:hypothetical protein
MALRLSASIIGVLSSLAIILADAAPAQTPDQPPQSAAEPNLPTIHVQGTSAAKHVHKRRARTSAVQSQAAPVPQPAPAIGMGSLSTAAAALPAGSTTLDAQQIAQTPIASYGDIFRALPGFEVANYGQGAIGYGLSMRGYTNAEHGRDIAYYIDGVPVNDISSIHTPNYADLNILMPETI